MLHIVSEHILVLKWVGSILGHVDDRLRDKSGRQFFFAVIFLELLLSLSFSKEIVKIRYV